LPLRAIHLVCLRSTPLPLDGLHEEQQQRHDQAVQRHTLGQANEDEGLTEGLVVLGDGAQGGRRGGGHGDAAADAAQARKEIEQGKLLVDSGRSLIEAGLQKTRSLAEEYVLRAKALMTDYAEPRRFELACHAYEQGIELIRANLSEEELAKSLFEYGHFLQTNKRYDLAEARYRENLDICQRLAAISPYAYEPDLAGTQNNLGVLYNNTQRYKESEKMYLSALEVYQRLTAVNPQVYEPYLVRACNNLSFLFLAQGNFEEAERYAREGSKYDFTHHAIYTNLAASLLLQGRYAEAEEIYLRYKEELKEDFLSDFEDFYRRGIIPPEREDDVERIKKLLSK